MCEWQLGYIIRSRGQGFCQAAQTQKWVRCEWQHCQIFVSLLFEFSLDCISTK